jgi:hypothetical protein
MDVLPSLVRLPMRINGRGARRIRVEYPMRPVLPASCGRRSSRPAAFHAAILYRCTKTPDRPDPCGELAQSTALRSRRAESALRQSDGLPGGRPEILSDRWCVRPDRGRGGKVLFHTNPAQSGAPGGEASDRSSTPAGWRGRRVTLGTGSRLRVRLSHPCPRGGAERLRLVIHRSGRPQFFPRPPDVVGVAPCRRPSGGPAAPGARSHRQIRLQEEPAGGSGSR